MLILLFADRRGDLRVVLTIRSAKLKNYAGQAALPGGKADTLQETPFQTARREAFEEIGLALTDDKLPTGYSVEHLAELPANLAMTELGVRPCVAYLRAPDPGPKNEAPDAARDLLPKLDAKEVAAVFTAPFHGFMCSRDEDESTRAAVPGEWYKGSWHSWHETAWRMHQFWVPVTPSTVFLASKMRQQQQQGDEGGKKVDTSDQNAAGATVKFEEGKADNRTTRSSSTLQPPLPRSFYRNPDDPLQQPRYRVFGMTARILVDAARVAYGKEPEFEHNSHFGDEEMIERLMRIGRLSPVKKEGEWLTREVMVKAKGAKL